MDGQIRVAGELIGTNGRLVAPPAKKGPRTLYRAQVRNEFKAARRLPEWRDQAAAIANQRADIAGRALMANGAREAAAKAAADNNARTVGLPREIVILSAMLDFYRNQKLTRSISRIIRDLERSVRSTARPALVV